MGRADTNSSLLIPIRRVLTRIDNKMGRASTNNNLFIPIRI